MNDRRLCQRDSDAMGAFMEQSRFDAAEVLYCGANLAFENANSKRKNGFHAPPFV